jgi:hypothetical protein
MTSLSDTLTVGLVLVLLFGSIALYLYTRVQQAEQKISLLESILLDLKMSAEIKSYSELPAVNHTSISQLSGGDYTLYEDDDNNDDISNNKANNDTSSVSSASSATSATSATSAHSTESIKDVDTSNINTPMEKVLKMAVNYESMTLKELQTMAKTRGITGANSMKKGSIIDALKTSDRSPTSIESGHTLLGDTSSAITLAQVTPLSDEYCA